MVVQTWGDNEHIVAVDLNGNGHVRVDKVDAGFMVRVENGSVVTSVIISHFDTLEVFNYIFRNLHQELREGAATIDSRTLGGRYW